MELCMKCKRTGENGFDCGHPDAHTPVFTLTEDANGELVEQPPLTPKQQRVRRQKNLDHHIASAEGRAQAAQHRADEAETESARLREENADLLRRLKQARPVTYPDRITVANAYDGPQQIAALRRAVESGARLHEADMRHMLGAVIREYDQRRAQLTQLPGGGYDLHPGDNVRIIIETVIGDVAHIERQGTQVGWTDIEYDKGGRGVFNLELPDAVSHYPETIITVEKRP